MEIKSQCVISKAVAALVPTKIKRVTSQRVNKQFTQVIIQALYGVL